MSQTVQQIRELVARRKIHISDHGSDELAEDNIFIDDIVAGIEKAVVAEDYPTYHKGPCVLGLQHDEQSQPIHVLWGIAKNTTTPAVVVTAYRPDPNRWGEDFLRRRR
ncbi:MAG: DUF4258 domain-containing protein [Candidatus Binatia bacterium]